MVPPTVDILYLQCKPGCTSAFLFLDKRAYIILLQKNAAYSGANLMIVSVCGGVCRDFYTLYTAKAYPKCAITASVMPWVFTFVNPSRYISPVR